MQHTQLYTQHRASPIRVPLQHSPPWVQATTHPSAPLHTRLTFLRSAAERARQRRIMYMSKPGMRSRSMAFPMKAEAIT